MQRTTSTTDRKYPFLARTLRKRQSPKTEESKIDHPLLRRSGDVQEPGTNKGKPLPPLPSNEELPDIRIQEASTETLKLPVVRPPTPYLPRHGVSSIFPFVENISSAYSSPSTLVSQEEAAVLGTQEWQEYRTSVATYNGVARIALTPEQTSLGSSDIDTDNRSTPVERSSTAGIFYHRTQEPVHAIDALQIIVNNLEALRREDFTREYHPTLERALGYISEGLSTLRVIPREVVQPIPGIRNFAEYLKYQIDHLRAKIINPENLTNPDLEQDIAKLRRHLQTRSLHRKFLRTTQRA